MNWDKWIIERLPQALRTIGLHALLRVLLSPIYMLYDDFIVWKQRMHTLSGVTVQACMLKKIVRDELGIDMLITEGDGKPIDFIIETSFTDIDKERQLFALLDRYKLAGKSYAYQNAEIVFESTWTGYVCEKKIINNIVITYYWRNDPAWGTVIYQVVIQADEPVKSDLTITLEVHIIGQPGNDTLDIPLRKGESRFEFPTWVLDAHISESVNPVSDEYFNYNLIIKDNYE